MPSEPNATRKKAGPSSNPSLQFIIEPEPWVRIFLGNLADSFRSQPPAAAVTSAPGQYWADAQVYRPAPWTFLADSLLAHVLTVAAVYGLTLLWLHQPHVMPDEIVQSQHIENYQISEYLPSVSQKKPEPPRRPVPQKADPAYAPQEIVSVHIDHPSTKQTIVNPLNPRLLTQDTPLPNIVVWTPTVVTAPVASNHPVRELPLTTPDVVPPIEQPTERKLNALQFDVQPRVVAPAEAPASRNLAALNLPATAEAAVPPSQTAAQRRLGDINLAMGAPAIDAPKLPVPEQTASSGQSGAAGPVRVYVPPPEPITAGTGRSEGKEVGKLLVANAQPVAPSGPMVVPQGNRQGEFAAGPTGRPGASGRPEIAAGNSTDGSKGGSGSPVSSVYIAPPPSKVTSGVVVSAPSPPSAPAGKSNASPDMPGHGAVPLERVDREVFGERRSYAMALNMPNLTSAGGTNWIIRFAEMHPAPGTAGDGVSAPEALSKFDPAYPPDLMRDRVEGTVILYAVIHTDGSVSDIRVLQGVDEKLDENARNALQKWHFRPGTKNGAPVDLEAVIRVPFRAPKKLF